MRHWFLPALLPTLLTPGLMGTVLFFNQTHLAELKGWNLLRWHSPSLASRCQVSWPRSGWLGSRSIWRTSAHTFLLPIGFGMALVSQATSITAWYLALSSMGITMGMSSALGCCFACDLRDATSWLNTTLTTTGAIFHSNRPRNDRSPIDGVSTLPLNVLIFCVKFLSFRQVHFLLKEVDKRTHSACSMKLLPSYLSTFHKYIV